MDSTVPGRPSADSQAMELDYWEGKGGLAEYDLHLRFYRQVFPFAAIDYAHQSILDVGSGPVSVFERIAPEAAAVTPFDSLGDEYNRIAPAKRFPVRSQLPDERFDVVSAFNCLDHMEAPAELLEALVTRLKPDGRVWIYCHVDRPFDPAEHPQCFRPWQLVWLTGRYYEIERCGLIREGLLFPYAWWGIGRRRTLSGPLSAMRVTRWTLVCGALYAWFHSKRAVIKAMKLAGLRRLLPELYRF